MDGNGHGDLLEDCIFEILLRLPVIAIGRFKCVCRHWYDVIESCEFREQHYGRQDNSPLFVEFSGGTSMICSGKSLRVMESYETMPLWSSYVTNPCRGLLLLYSGGQSFCLLNPATRACRLLPAIPNLVFPHTTSHLAYGLGWDPSTDDYKVVIFFYLVGVVYSLNNNSWRFLDPPPKLNSNHIFSHNRRKNMHTDGFCYWLSPQANSLLISFDVTQENFVTITLPPNVINDHHIVLSTYYDSLGLLDWEKERKTIEVWILKQEQQHYWTKVYSFRQTDPTIRPLGIWNNTHVLLKKYGLQGSKDLLVYDMKNLHYEENVRSPEHRTRFLNYMYSLGYVYFLNYKKSLFSV